MFDPRSILDTLPKLTFSLDLQAVLSSLVSLGVAYGVGALVHYLHRGKKIGALSVSVTVTKTPGWFKTHLAPWGISEKATERIGTGLAVTVFCWFTSLSFDQFPLPGKPVTPVVLALVAALNLLWLSKTRKGRCIGFERGLLVEGVFHSFEKVQLHREGDSLVLDFGKSRCTLSVADFEKNKALIRDGALHVKFETLTDLCPGPSMT